MSLELHKHPKRKTVGKQGKKSNLHILLIQVEKELSINWLKIYLVKY